MNFIHRLFNPHCPECADMDKEELVCESCEILKIQLDAVSRERDKLLDALLGKKEEPRIDVTELEPLQNNKFIPWAVRRQMLERDDRIKARQTKDDTTEKLEKEILDVPS